ncbi:hypothetical protein ACTFIW_003746 [Dictyostelium discoideum]
MRTFYVKARSLNSWKGVLYPKSTTEEIGYNIPLIETHGNPCVHLILRGSTQSTNYHRGEIEKARVLLTETGLNQSLIVDCSHGNSQGDFHNQKKSIPRGTGCSSNKNWISAQIYPYGNKKLASYQLDTPDSLKDTQNPTELPTIEWKIASKPHLEMNSYHLQDHIRFKDGSEKSVKKAIHRIVIFREHINRMK